MLRWLGKHRVRALCWVAAIMLILIATASGLAIRRWMGEDYQRQAYEYAAAENTVMMDVYWYDAEAKDAIKAGDTRRSQELQKTLQETRALASEYRKERLRLEQAAAAILGPEAAKGLPPGVEKPNPQYYLPEAQRKK